MITFFFLNMYRMPGILLCFYSFVDNISNNSLKQVLL